MHATPGKGIQELIYFLNQKNASIYIVSHKTQFSARKSLDLIEPATTWLQNVTNQNFQAIDLPFFFEGTRKAKIQRIKQLELTHFADDLLEIFTDDLFPRLVKGFLLCGESKEEVPQNVIKVGTFKEILKHV